MAEETLQQLVDEGIIDAVHSRLMSGKEASVFIVERAGTLIAAKVYKDRQQRTFRSTADYTEGRNQTRNTRDKRAMHKQSRYGKGLVDEQWRDMEYRALSEAFHAGVRVPEPYMLYEDVLLMELLVDEEGNPAPRIADFNLPPDVAELLHREIFGQVRMLLACGKVHGDLSAFNILMTHAGPTIIDMPQVVDASGNNQAQMILCRDLNNITEHLARFDPRLQRFVDCGNVLWAHYQRGTLDRAQEPEVFEARPPPRQRQPDQLRARGHHQRQDRGPAAFAGEPQSPQRPQQRPDPRRGPQSQRQPPRDQQHHARPPQQPRDPQQQRQQQAPQQRHPQPPRDPQQQRQQQAPQQRHPQPPRDPQQQRQQHQHPPEQQRDPPQRRDQPPRRDHPRHDQPRQPQIERGRQPPRDQHETRRPPQQPKR